MPNNRLYPDYLAIEPLQQPPRAQVHVPGSKSITNRALILAALRTKVGETCSLQHVLHSEDTHVMMESLRRLGWIITEDGDSVLIQRSTGSRLVPHERADLYIANSGTSMRFLTALVSLGSGMYRIDGNARMRQRPIQDLIDALRTLGVDIQSEHDNGCPPVLVQANGWPNSLVAIRGDTSSQFLSALLLTAPSATREILIELHGPLVSEPYVTMSIDMVRQFGGHIDRPTERRFHVYPQVVPGPTHYIVEPDASAASYFFAAAALTGGTVTVTGLSRRSLQGDVAFVDVLAQMGCRVEECDSGITVHGRPLRSVEVDMNAISDTVMTLAAVACFAEGTTTIRNVAHIRHKETDRLTALATELRKLGMIVEVSSDGLKLTPAPLQGAVIETYDDHRMAMSLALIGLRVPGIVIRDPGCVAKTYPDFWTDMEQLRTR
jgi:3-phosphoshikimate 1-carboxyvinyltransferase